MDTTNIFPAWPLMSWHFAISSISENNKKTAGNQTQRPFLMTAYYLTSVYSFILHLYKIVGLA